MRIVSVADRPAVHSPMTPTGCGQAAHAPRMRRATCLPRDACNSYSPDGLERLVLGRRHVRPTGVLSTADSFAGRYQDLQAVCGLQSRWNVDLKTFTTSLVYFKMSATFKHNTR